MKSGTPQDKFKHFVSICFLETRETYDQKESRKCEMHRSGIVAGQFIFIMGLSGAASRVQSSCSSCG